MSVSLDVRIRGIEGAQRRLDQVSLTSPEFKQGMRKAVESVKRQVQRNLTGGNPLNVRTGLLRRSVKGRVIRKRKAYEGIVGPQRVPYARIHELGGIIRPKRAKALVFKIGNRWIRTQKVTMPKRPYLKPAALKKSKAVAKILGKAIVGANSQGRLPL